MMKSRPNVDQFLEGADKESPAKKKNDEKRSAGGAEVPVKKEPKVQKNFRIRKSLADKLKLEAVKKSIEIDDRVTEESIIEQLLEDYFEEG